MNEKTNDIDELPYKHPINEFPDTETLFRIPDATKVDSPDVCAQANFAALYTSLYPFAFFLARRFVSREDANDIVSNIFAKLWRQEYRLKKIINFKAFLSTSVRNACLDHISNESSRALREEGWHYLAYGPEAKTYSFNEEIGAEKLALIYGEMKNLPPRCRKVFQMAYLDNLKNDQIAHLMGITVLTVKTQKSNALKALRMALISIFPFLVFILNRVLPF